MKENILLVDDEEALRSSLSLRLRGEGYIVDTAADATEGFEKATSLPFDLIILDLMLPDRNGLDVCKAIREAGIANGLDRSKRASPNHRQGSSPQAWGR
jgi:two-component system alkaline phosphatase synthesis response regulator PhoP